MATWGVLRSSAGGFEAERVGADAVVAGVSEHLEGLVAVAEETPVRDVLALLPAAVTRVVELGPAEASDPSVGDLLAGLLAAADDAHDAVVGARPLADALKRVEGDEVVEGIVRDGLLTPMCIAVIDRAALETVASTAPGCDAVALLLGAGRAVRVMTDAGERMTIRTGRA